MGWRKRNIPGKHIGSWLLPSVPGLCSHQAANRCVGGQAFLAGLSDPPRVRLPCNADDHAGILLVGAGCAIIWNVVSREFGDKLCLWRRPLAFFDASATQKFRFDPL